jgi:hypothetical protein
VRCAHRRWRRRGARARAWTQSEVRCRRLLQTDGHVGRAEMEIGGGGVGSVPRGGRKMGESGGGGARHGSADHWVTMALGGTVEGGSTRSRWRQAGEQGRAVGRGQRGAAWLTGGAGRQRGPVSKAGCRRESGK